MRSGAPFTQILKIITCLNLNLTIALLFWTVLPPLLVITDITNQKSLNNYSSLMSTTEI